jgi:hypothetical protein
MERLTKEGLVDGLDVDVNSPALGQCEACIEGKMTTKFSAVTTDEYITKPKKT